MVSAARAIGAALGVVIPLAAASDLFRGFSTLDFRFRAIGELWQWLYFRSEHYVLTWVKGHSTPYVWSDVVLPAPGLPALPVFLAVALLCLVLLQLVRQRRRR